MYANERASCAERDRHAQEYPEDILAMIVDIMDAYKLKLPHGGSQCEFKAGIDSCLVGVLVQGSGLNLYRTCNTIKKGADLIIHCILAQIDVFIRRKKKSDIVKIFTSNSCTTVF